MGGGGWGWGGGAKARQEEGGRENTREDCEGELGPGRRKNGRKRGNRGVWLAGSMTELRWGRGRLGGVKGLNNNTVNCGRW